ncbi:hypothetical protein Ddye_008793 [Dipteronia dyeriana]|uniref:Reverse transcriptase domain-containing protein n=1 Tax=Dipteronia dyeriana TaxID=168575 RepID=A0AAD9XA52_9ROSI|nr:hypothetical protein Ddye_008793 [Dipteronia dyeriana]
MRFIVGFHWDRAIVKVLNKTFIACVPKCGKPESLADYTPISKVSSMYKILVKMLTNRLKEVMDFIIIESQTAFVKNRQILDIFVVAKEITQMWKRDMKACLSNGS